MEISYESFEAQKALKILNVLQLTPQEDCVLKERIARYAGNVNILVHPYFLEDEPVSQRGPTSTYLRERDTLIQASLNSLNTPLIIFEESRRLPFLRDRLSNQQGTLYVIQTHREKPTPNIPYLEIKPHDDKIAWSLLKGALQDLGVRSINIGGRYLFFAALEDSEGIPDIDSSNELRRLKEIAIGKTNALLWLNMGILPYGCAGSAAQQLLREGFDVSLSTISSPDVFIPQL